MRHGLRVGAALVAAWLLAPQAAFAEVGDTQAGDAVGAVKDPIPAAGDEGGAQRSASTESARDLFAQGVTLAQAGKWAEAVEAFQQSIAIDERPGTVFNLALALEHSGDLPGSLRAWEHFLDIAAEGDEGRAVAQRELDSGRAKLGTLDLTVAPDAARAEVDGVEITGAGPSRRLYLAPGLRELAVSAEGYVPRTLQLSAAAGETLEQTVRLDLIVPPAAAPPAPAQRKTTAPLEPVTDPEPADAGQQRRSGFWRNPFVWVTASVLVAAAGVTTYFVVSGNRNEPAQPAPTYSGGSVKIEL